jgi:hypothetical protein
LHYLGKRSTTKTSEGIRIVTLGGQLDDAVVGGVSKEQYLPFHTVDDAKALRGANTADILLTTAWPASIRTGSKIPISADGTEPNSYQHISDLVAALKPRYHFSNSSFWFEREPFFHSPTPDAPDARPLTRFISLAPHANPSKEKALYAFTLQPSADPLAPLPVGTTASPFRATENGKKRSPLEPEPYSRFSNGHENSHNRHKHGRRDPRAPKPGPDTCFFCLSNPNIGTHLVTSIGDDAYVTTAKGPLTTSTTNASLGLSFPAHALIIPLTHSPTLALVPISEEGTREKTFSEMSRYKSSIQSMIAFQSSNKLGAVTFEISRVEGIHTHWQLIPIPVDLIRKGLVEAAFKVEAENMQYPQFVTRDPGIGTSDEDFFRVWVWAPPIPISDDDDDDENSPSKTAVTKCITMPIDGNMRFDLQFGRRVLAKLLGLEKRLQWRDCSQTEDEEKVDVKAFKAAFKEFDPM